MGDIFKSVYGDVIEKSKRNALVVDAIIGNINSETGAVEIIAGKQRVHIALDEGFNVHIETPDRGMIQVWRDSGAVRAQVVEV